MVDLASTLDPSREIDQLSPSEGGKEVGEPVVVADLGVLVVRRGLAGLGGEVTAAGRDPPRPSRPCPHRRS